MAMVIDNPDRLKAPLSSNRRQGGRHLDASRDDALRSAALKLLAQIGYDRLTVEKVAVLAGAGKATIYRRWSGKAELVVDAIVHERPLLATPNSGTLKGDLEILAQRVATTDQPMDSQVMIGLVSALPRDVELREVFRERLVEPHVATLLAVFERAVERGEIAPVKNLDIVISIFPALVLHRLLILGTVPDQAFITSIIDDAILPLVLVRPDATTPIESPLS